MHRIWCEPSTEESCAWLTLGARCLLSPQQVHCILLTSLSFVREVYSEVHRSLPTSKLACAHVDFPGMTKNPKPVMLMFLYSHQGTMGRRVMRGRRELPGQEALPALLCAEGKSLDPCRSGLVCKCLVHRHQRDKGSKTTTGDITSILGATGSQA